MLSLDECNTELNILTRQMARLDTETEAISVKIAQLEKLVADLQSRRY